MKYNDEQFDALLVQALESAAQREAMDLQTSPSIKQSIQSEQRIKNLIRRVEKQKKWQSKPLHKRVMRQVAAIFIAAILLVGTIYIIPDARAFVSGLLHTWFPDHFQYEITGETPNAKPEDMVIGYIPDGFDLTNEFTLEGINAYYMFETQTDNIHVDITASATRVHLDNEHSTFYQLVLDDGSVVDAYEASKAAFPSSVVKYFDDVGILITVTTTLDIDEAIAVIASIN